MNNPTGQSPQEIYQEKLSKIDGLLVAAREWLRFGHISPALNTVEQARNVLKELIDDTTTK